MSRHGEDNQSTSGEQPASDSLRVSRDRLDWMEREHSQEDTDTDALVPHIVIILDLLGCIYNLYHQHKT